ncbi:DUF3102 domain-containing protein [Enterococcus sp. HY326]|uniref:DUF3102 domain-containing protein n=1 Tax=Enterococcus sp. HY326 TaxID=2971265 RepID=UPI00223F7115|nr:DUF3102 domain-containing protein [Enterococcus sp. HY326]
MNDLSLSNDLNVISAEINSYKQIAGHSIWEIGRRLNHVKENDLAHGKFLDWVNSTGTDRTEAFRFMKVAKELPNVDTWQHLGNRALYLITTLPEEERFKEHETSKGEVKTPDKMTVRELEELKKQLKRKDEQIENLSEVINQMSGQPPDPIVKEVTVETVPEDYYELQEAAALVDGFAKENQSLKNEQERLKLEAEESKRALQAKRTMENDELEQAQLKRLQRDADISVHKLILNLNEFVKEQAVTVYDSQAITGASPETKAKLNEGIKRVENLLNEIKKEIGGEVTWIID